MSRPKLAWAIIKEGMQYVAGGATMLLGTVAMYPNLFGVERCQKVMQMYRDGEPQPVGEDSKRIAQKVLDTVLWDTISEANVNLFTVNGQDITHLGSTFSRWGGYVGIPVNFRYRKTQDVERELITLNNQLIDWDLPAGRQLLDSLVLSERARQFAIARELFYLKTYHPYVQGFLLNIAFFSAYWMGAATNVLYNLKRKLPVGSRIVIYSFFAGVGATLYCFAWDNYSWYRDRKVDKKASQLGLEYAEGGVEFYNKLLQRNMALRALMGEVGGKKYTAYGNDVYFWRSSHVPLTSRRDTLVKMAGSLRESALKEMPHASPTLGDSAVKPA